MDRSVLQAMLIVFTHLGIGCRFEYGGCSGRGESGGCGGCGDPKKSRPWVCLAGVSEGK